MRKMKLKYAMLAIVLVMALSGCSPGLTPEQTNAALEHMESVYGEKFEYVGPWLPDSTPSKERQILVSCESMPDKEILVVINEDGETYADNYMDFYFEDQVEDFLNVILQYSFDSAELELDIAHSPSSDYISPKTDFYSYIHNENTSIRGNLVVEPLNEDVVMKFTDILVTDGIYFSLEITDTAGSNGYAAQFLNGENGVFIERK